MKNQFQKSYELFMKAHNSLASISFENLKINVLETSDTDQLPQRDVDDILKSKSLDACLENLNTKLNVKNIKLHKAPEFREFMDIVSELHTGTKSLAEYQNTLTELNEDLNEKIDGLQLATFETLNEIEKLTQMELQCSEEEENLDEFSDNVSDSSDY